MCRNIRRVGSVMHFIFVAAAALTLVFVSPGVPHSQAQAQRRPTIEERQQALRSVKKTYERPVDITQEQNLKYEQSKEDFELLQVISSRLSEAVGSGPGPDYVQIGKDAAEVRKRAARLKVNLAFPEPAKDEKSKKSWEEFSAEEIKSAISTLDDLVKSFVSNPIFQQPRVLNVERSARAMRDLELIIKLSEQIQRRAEALSKAMVKKL
jgi:hypothetical protein